MSACRHSLFSKLNWLTILINLACYMLIGAALYRHLDARANAQTQSFVTAACQQVTSAITTFTSRYEWHAEMLSTDYEINSFLNARRDTKHLSYALFEKYRNIGSRFSQLLATDPTLLSIQLMKDDPNLLGDGQYVRRPDAAFREYLAENPKSVNRWIILNDQFYLLNTPKLTKGGLLAMRLSENALYQSLGVRGEGFDYYLVDAHHIVLSSSDRSLPKRALPAALQIALEAGTLREIEGNVLCYPEAIGELQVLITYDVSDMRAANARAVSGMLLVVVMAMLTSIALLSLMGRSFSDNIRRILQKLRIMREGQFAQPLTVHTGDELEQIDDSICDLGCNVARLSQSLVDAAQRQKALELRFLQMQINRHFLHNSLSSLRWMAVRKGEDELAELMESLIAFYRVTLSQDDILLLQDEITLVENYVRLENVIHLGDLHFHCDIPETLKTIRVCKMALQPFVENAIHHGKIQGQVLDIWLSAEEMAGSIILRVEDNGHGMTRERVAELQEIFQGKKSGGDSIAIYNTLSRLRGLYGMDVDLSIMVRQGTVIEIMLPLQEE